MQNGQRWKIVIGPNGYGHEADKEKRGEGQDRINHFLFGDEVHEVSGHEKGLRAGDDERNDDIDRGTAEVDERGPNSKGRAGDQRPKNKQIAANVMTEMVVVMAGSCGAGCSWG